MARLPIFSSTATGRMARPGALLSWVHPPLTTCKSVAVPLRLDRLPRREPTTSIARFTSAWHLPLLFNKQCVAQQQKTKQKFVHLHYLLSFLPWHISSP